MFSKKTAAALAVAGTLTALAAVKFLGAGGDEEVPIDAGNYLISRVAMQDGDYSTALRSREAMLRLAPQDIDLQVQAFDAALAAGNMDRARELAPAIETQSEAAQLLLLAQAYRDHNDQEVTRRLAALEQGGRVANYVAHELNRKKDQSAQSFAQVLHAIAREFQEVYAQPSALAVSYARLALFTDPATSDAVLTMAGIEANGGRFLRALEWLDSIPPEHEQYPVIQVQKSRVLDAYGDSAGAANTLAALAQTLQNSPLLTAVLLEQGRLAARQGNHNDAVAFFSKVIENTIDDAENISARYNRALSYDAAGQWPRAEADLRRVLAIDSENVDALNYLGYRLADQNINLEDALYLTSKANNLTGGRSSHVLDSYGWALHRLGHFEKAVKALALATELTPSSPELLFHYGEALNAAGRTLEARWEWNRVITMTTLYHADNPEMQKWAVQAQQRLNPPGVAPNPAP